MKRHRGRGLRQIVESELETLPLMGLFVVLIPMLLLSAVFLEISVIDMALPTDGDQAEEPAFSITVHIGGDAYVVEAKGFTTRTIPIEDEASGRVLAEALAAAVSTRRDHHAVTIVSRSDTRYEDIIEVMDISREAGLSQVSLTGEGS